MDGSLHFGRELLPKVTHFIGRRFKKGVWVSTPIITLNLTLNPPKLGLVAKKKAF